MSLPTRLTLEASLLLLVFPATFLGMASPQSAASGGPPAQSRVISQPSLGEVARVERSERKAMDLSSVPLYTNDNLPMSDAGLSVLGPSISPAGAAESNALPAARSQAAGKQIAYLRHKLNQAQQRLSLHQRELAVLQQQFSQSRMQWYPNPNQTLMQEYSRRNVSGLANQINAKQQQIDDDQQKIGALNDQLERAQARFGWVNSAAQAAAGSSQTALPPGVERGTPQYWQSRIQAAREQLATAKEESNVAKNELSLLKLRQLRSLDPNVQANLASSASEKEAEISAAEQAVEKARQTVEALEKEAKAGPLSNK